MYPRTLEQEFDIQLQIHQNKEFARILRADDECASLRSISLKPGYEYNLTIAEAVRDSTLWIFFVSLFTFI